MLWVTVHVSISAAFLGANVKVKLRWFNQLFLYVFVFVCLYTVSAQSVSRFLFRMELEFYFLSSALRGRKGDRLGSVVFFLWFRLREQSAYNNVRTFKWRDIYRIVLELVRCWSQTLHRLPRTHNERRKWNLIWKNVLFSKKREKLCKITKK